MPRAWPAVQIMATAYEGQHIVAVRQPRYTRPMTTHRHPLLPTFIALCLALATVGASAQWGYTDKDGRRIFSDQAPPLDIPEKSIFRRPGAAAKPDFSAPPASAPATPASASASSALKPSGKDAALEKKKKDADAAEALKKKAEEQKNAESRALSCERAKRAKATFDSGIRVSSTDAKGERVILGDAERASEVKRVNDIIAQDCK